jgi:hypothetical protein
VKLVLLPGLPFTDRDLRAATELRVSVGGVEDVAATEVTVASAGPGRVTIATAARSRDVFLGARAGAEAARLVAVLIVDMLGEHPTLPTLPTAPVQTAARDEPEATAKAGDSTTNAAATATAAASPRTLRRLSVAAFSSVNLALTDAGPSFEPSATLAWSLSPAWRVSLSVGYAQARALDPTGAELVSFRTVPVRAGVGYGYRWLELAAGPLGRAYWTSGVGNTRGMAFGGWLALRASLPVRWAIRPSLIGGIDARVERLELRAAGRSLISAGYVSPWIGIGIGWGEDRG